MVSKRYRANKSLTNKVQSVSSKTSALSKSTKDPRLGRGVVSGDNIAPGSLRKENFASDSVTDVSVASGAVGSDNLGVVSTIPVDQDLVLKIPGNLVLSGPEYSGGVADEPRPLVVLDDGTTIPGASLWWATIDPYWTYGAPKLTLTATGTEVYATGWYANLSPQPGNTVQVAHDGTGWVIVGVGATSNSLAYPNNVTLPLKNSWVRYSASWLPASVSKTSDGYVTVTGLIKNGTTAPGTVITTLPAGFRPDYDMLFPIIDSTNARTVLVRQTGDIEIYGEAWLGTNYTSLANIMFPAQGVASWTDVSSYNNGWASWKFPEEALTNIYAYGDEASGTYTLSSVTGGPEGGLVWTVAPSTSSDSSWMFFSLNNAYFRASPGERVSTRVYVKSSMPSALLRVLHIAYNSSGSVIESLVDYITLPETANTYTLYESGTRVLPNNTYRVSTRISFVGTQPHTSTLTYSSFDIRRETTGRTLRMSAGSLRYWMDPANGQTFVQGVVYGGTAATSIGTIQTTSARPVESHIFPSASPAPAISQIRIQDTGVISHTSGGSNNARIPVSAVYRSVSSTLTWVTPTFSNSWANYGGEYATAKYAKSAGGLVFLEGLIKSGTLSVAAYATNAGYRVGPVVGGSETSGMIFLSVSANEFGRVDLYMSGSTQASNESTSNSWVSFSGVAYVAGQ